MDRFETVPTSFRPSCPVLVEEHGVSIYSNETKTECDRGSVQLTESEVLWHNHQKKLRLPLENIACTEMSKAGLFGKDKVTLHFTQKEGTPSGEYIKLSIKNGDTFNAKINKLLQEESWKKYRSTTPEQQTSPAKQAPPRTIATRSGIVGIERAYEQQAMKTESSIQVAFEDLKKLMQSAEEMVTLAKDVSRRISEKKGSITDDETVLFKSYLLTLGIDDPVTKDTHGTSDNYYQKLGEEVEKALITPVQEAGGLLSLADAYCRLNRARGLVLVSPEDLLKACQTLGPERQLQLYSFPTGVYALQSRRLDAKRLEEETLRAIEKEGPQTIESFAMVIGISVILARERLLSAERVGHLCRDDSVEGLRFYPNLFLQRSS